MSVAKTPSLSPSAPGYRASTDSDAASLILASASPRRRELLEQIGVRYHVLVHAIDESRREQEAPERYVSRLAQQKATSVAQTQGIALPVLGADTIVVCEDRVLGKPTDQEHALAMLKLLSGRRHTVITAVCVATAMHTSVLLSRSQVRFRALTEAEMLAYWQSGEPRGKAGGYAVQGLGAIFIESLSGSYSGVMGLPLYETALLLKQVNVPLGLDACCSKDGYESGFEGGLKKTHE